ncbi:Similar to Timp: Tissue inhibitor of metalloproteinase (Drosophila melanogaster) [Cotesia congregata]|uniref:Similar to Timp: Tissue inhibitor of metalloproteinase (Drosophila melanogaster) n=1 Tax=Cotesia congregata TaxID=51543 RepID=A0A8J2H519_COTCN|nr:Similar to Timp: Tissue inhibitor of metalloproteinase (Drosophila melanogaster) [Cotesia congregata]
MNRFLLLFILNFVAVYEANACSCVGFSLQEQFCHSDFVIKVKVEDVAKMNQSSILIYQVNILETYKATDEAKSALQLKLLTTNPILGMCGLELQRDQVAVVGGKIINGQPNIGICYLHIRNSGEIEAQETNLRENFVKSCVSA